MGSGNPHKPGSWEWQSFEQHKARQGISTGTDYNRQEREKLQRQNSGYNYGSDVSSHRKDYSSSSVGPGCFTAETLIKCPGEERIIAEVREGDFVLSWCSASETLCYSTVLRWIEHRPKRITELAFCDGTTIRTTTAHTFLTDQGWLVVSRLRKGHRFRTHSGWKVLIAISTIAQREPVFNLVTSEYFNFIVGDVIAHNFTWFKKTKSFFWKQSMQNSSQILVESHG